MIFVHEYPHHSEHRCYRLVVDYQIRIILSKSHHRSRSPIIGVRISCVPPHQPRPQILHRTIPLQRVAVPAKQLQVIKMTSPTLRLRHNMVHRQMLRQEMRPAPVAVPALRPIKHHLRLAQWRRRLTIRPLRNIRPRNRLNHHPSTQAHSEPAAPPASPPTPKDRSRSTADPTLSRDAGSRTPQNGSSTTSPGFELASMIAFQQRQLVFALDTQFALWLVIDNGTWNRQSTNWLQRGFPALRPDIASIRPWRASPVDHSTIP